MKFFTDRQSRHARRWSNRELLKLGHLFSGHIANVSGWDDGDKEGRHYRDYFPNASNYSVTNHAGDRGLQGHRDEIALDLEQSVPAELVRRFDVVLSHTVLEHIFDVFAAFRHLCELSNDAVIVVVPFSQLEHWTESYGDYWRFTPHTMKALFARQGFSLIYHAANHDWNAAIYLVAVGVRDPARWSGRFPQERSRRALGDRIGRSFVFDRVAQCVRFLREVAGR
jgi:hypothetical protein